MQRTCIFKVIPVSSFLRRVFIILCTVAESIFDDHIGTNSSYIIDRLVGICDLEVEIDKSIEFQVVENQKLRHTS